MLRSVYSFLSSSSLHCLNAIKSFAVWLYDYFLRRVFFEENDIAIEKSNMSFSVSVRDSNIEYCGKGFSGIFSNKSNLLNLKFLKMFFTIISFYKQSENQDPFNDNITLGSYFII